MRQLKATGGQRQRTRRAHVRASGGWPTQDPALNVSKQLKDSGARDICFAVWPVLAYSTTKYLRTCPWTCFELTALLRHGTRHGGVRHRRK